jgi:hypothetical protein
MPVKGYGGFAGVTDLLLRRAYRAVSNRRACGMKEAANRKGGEPSVQLLWIILIVVLVLLLLGFFSRGRW